MSVVLVLGAGGFIGRSVCAAIEQLPGVELAGGGLGPAPAGFVGRWLDVDLAATPTGAIVAMVDELGPSAVVNCTGATAGSPRALVEANVATVACLLEALPLLALPARFVQIGSAAEYGPGPRDVAVREDAPARPAGPYGATKLAATQLTAAAIESGAIEGVVLRVFNALGPGMPEGTLPGAALARLREAVATGARTIAMGPLDSVRDFVDVRDIAAAVAAACTAGALAAPVLNVGSGTPHAARDLVAALARRIGFEGAIEEVADAASPRSRDVPWQVADIALARRTLGWRPQHDLDSSADAMVSFALGADSASVDASRASGPADQP